MTTALEAFFARIPRRIGYRGDGRSWLLTTPIDGGPRGGPREPVPMVDFYGRVTAAFDAPVRDRRYELVVRPEQDAAIDTWMARHGLDDGRPIVGLNPGAKFGSSKLWKSERFAEAGDQISAGLDAHIVLLGGPGEEPLLDDIARRMTRPHVDSGRDIIPLGVLAAFVRRLALMVTTDTGPRAMAQALRVPTVVVMGSTDPRWTDANNELARVLRHDVDCGPCHKKVCDLDHRCMELVTTDEVVGATRALHSSS